MCKVILIFSSALVLFSLIGAGAGIWLDYWFQKDNTVGVVTTTIRAGLWNRCTKVSTSGTEVCDSYDDTNTTVVPDSLQAVRIVVLCGAALLLLAVVTLCIKCSLLEDQKRTFTVIISVITMLGGLTLIAGTIVYGTLTRDQLGIEISNLYIGFGLVIGAAVLSIIASILLCVSKEREVKDDGE